MRHLMLGLCFAFFFAYAANCGPTVDPNDCTKNGTCSEQTEPTGDAGTSVPERKVGDLKSLRWNKVTVPTTEDLWGIAIPVEGKAWVVGAKGTILYSGDFGKTWKAQTSGTSETLRSASFINDKEGWVVGDKGVILQTKDGGATWSTLKSPVSETLWSVHFLSAKLGYAVGDGFSLLRTNDGGGLWNPTSQRLEIDMYSVFFTSETNGYMVGSNGTILFTDDGALTVTNEPTGTDQAMRALTFIGKNEIWAVGASGQLLHKAPNAGWARPASGVDSGLYGVLFLDGQRGWAVGKYGVILGTSNGGKQWENEARLTFPDLTAMAGRSFASALVVGKGGTILRLEAVKDECKVGDSRDCYSGPSGSKGVGRCVGGTQRCVAGVWAPCEGEVLPADKEICFNNQDDNCNGKSEIEDKCPPCKENERRECYTGPDKTDGVGLCVKGEQFCRNDKWDVCENEIKPSEEKCNGSDDDCDGKIDNDTKNPPACDETIGVCVTGKKICKNGAWQTCEAAQFGSDYQDKEDKCDGKDNDCDGTLDENCPCTKDGETRDCYGGPASSAGQGACQKGTQTCTSGTWTECTGEVKPVEEICEDKKDNDCDGKVDEKTQYALTCNANWSYASVSPSSALEPTTNMTIEGWFNFSSFPTSERTHTLVSITEQGGYSLTINNPKRGSSNIRFRMWPKGAKSYASAEAKVDDFLKKDQWHHVAGTYDGKKVRLWIDGKMAAEIERTDPIEYNARNVPLVFGAEAASGGIDKRNGNHMGGSIAQIRLSNKALYSLAFKPECVLTKTADTIGLWLLEEGKGDTLKDETGNHNGKWNGPGWDEAPRCPGFAKGGGCK